MISETGVDLLDQSATVTIGMCECQVSGVSSDSTGVVAALRSFMGEIAVDTAGYGIFSNDVASQQRRYIVMCSSHGRKSRGSSSGGWPQNYGVDIGAGPSANNVRLRHWFKGKPPFKNFEDGDNGLDYGQCSCANLTVYDNGMYLHNPPYFRFLMSLGYRVTLCLVLCN